MVSRQKYYAIKEALTPKEKALINYYELRYAMNHEVPTIEEAASYLKLKQITVNYYLQRRPVVKALNQRGIPWQQHTREDLTATQVATAITIMNFADTRSNNEKLDQLGVNPSQYYAWLKDPQFKTLIDTLADQNLENIRPTAIAEFTKKINQGDWQAVRYWLETTGELQNNDQPRSEELVKMLIEIIQRHVKDPEVIIAIAKDIKLASANRTLEVVTQPKQLTGELVEHDPELEEARKKLGV